MSRILANHEKNNVSVGFASFLLMWLNNREIPLKNRLPTTALL